MSFSHSLTTWSYISTGQINLLDLVLLRTSFNPKKQWSSPHIVPAPFSDLCIICPWEEEVKHLCCNEQLVQSSAIAVFLTDELCLQHRLRKKDCAQLSPQTYLFSKTRQLLSIKTKTTKC